MDSTIAVIIMVAFLGGLIAGMIAYSKSPTGGTFIGYFVFGALLPLIGVIAALLLKPAPKPPGWHPDPWQDGGLRYHDGRDWTGYTSGT